MGEVKRVALVSMHTCPLAMLGGKKTGGMNVYVRDLSRELGRRGVAVDVFTRRDEACASHDDHSEIGPGARVIHVPAGPETLEGPQRMADYLPEFAEWVLAFAEQEELRYDVIHSHYWLSGWAAETLREAWDAPVLQMFHTLGRMKDRVARNTSETEDPLRVEVETRLVRSVDCLLAATPAERAQLMWLYDAEMRRIKVIPPGVDTALFRPLDPQAAREEIGVKATDKMLLFVGRIEPLKGIDILIQAAARLSQERADICVTVIGGDAEVAEGEEMARLMALREELGVKDLVTFLGAHDQGRLPYYYSATEVMVMPSDYESFGMVALEAMACGTPVIASEVGGLAFLVQDGVTGFHVPYRDPDELAGKIRLLIDNPALREEMSAAALAHAQTYDWSLIGEQVLGAYGELADMNGR